MWIALFLIISALFSTTQAGDACENVLDDCHRNNAVWTGCYEEKMTTCETGLRRMPNFIRLMVNSSQEVEGSPTPVHRVHIPSSALQRSRGAPEEEEVQLMVTVINSTYFQPSTPRAKGRSRALTPNQSAQRQYIVMGGLVLAVKAGSQRVSNLPQPIKLTFTHNKQVQNGSCVFWQSVNGTSDWSTDGCDTHDDGTQFVCSCNHLSFFAVLLNPELSVDETNSTNLSYITYVGSALSVFFTVISFILYIYLRRRRPEKSIGVHMQLTGALFCLHLSFLLCSFWVWLLEESEDGWVCRFLGLFLHWSLLASFSWMALEGFHLYLLIVRVFNIYVRRYLLKLSLVGWGLPTLIAVTCGISGVYGKYSLELRDAKNHTSAAQMCWMSSKFPQRLVVSYITTVAFPGLVILYNSCMLGLVVFKLCRLRGGNESSGSWKKINEEKGSRLWKDCATVLGLSCVLGLPWGLASTTYISLPGVYVFTILNSLQGVFMFLWSVALTCKSRSSSTSSVRDPSSQKMITVSFNN